MSGSLSANTKAILLLTAPLIVGRRAPGDRSVEPLSLNREYNRLAKRLREIERAPADLLGADAGSVLAECLGGGDSVYVRSTLGRSNGLAALEARGALPWPNPQTAEELGAVLNHAVAEPPASAEQRTLVAASGSSILAEPRMLPFDQRADDSDGEAGDGDEG